MVSIMLLLLRYSNSNTVTRKRNWGVTVPTKTLTYLQHVLPISLDKPKTNLTFGSTKLTFIVMKIKERIEICLHLVIEHHLPDDYIAYILSKKSAAALSQYLLLQALLYYGVSDLASLNIVEKLIATFSKTTRAVDDEGRIQFYDASSLSNSPDVVKIILDTFPIAFYDVNK